MREMETKDVKYGPYVRLWGIEQSQLPPANASPDQLKPFLSSLLGEAVPFISTVPTSSSSNGTPWKPAGVKKFSHSSAQVRLFQRIVPGEELELVVTEHKLPGVDIAKVVPETWSLRRSVHEDAPLIGTANWDEWVRCFKDNHAEAEKDFTGSILSTAVQRSWDCGGIEIELHGQTWINWTLKLEESVHKLPAPLKRRVFPVLQATASARDTREFLVVQIASRDKDASTRHVGAIVGAYTSIERCRSTADGIEWIMGTVSDAKGVLPAWMQRMAVPGQVAKDVDMFLAWIAKGRKKENASEPGASVETGEVTS